LADDSNADSASAGGIPGPELSTILPVIVFPEQAATRRAAPTPADFQGL
jgi:hypothetical protein